MLALTLVRRAVHGVLHPAHVIIIADLSGLARRSTLAMRDALAKETVPLACCVSAMGAACMTTDPARAAAPLTGAGPFVALGSGRADLAIVAVHALGDLLTRRAGGARGLSPPERQRPALGQAQPAARPGHVRDPPTSLAALCRASPVNAMGWPCTSGLLPSVAREIRHLGGNGLGSPVAAFAIGSRLGTRVVSLARRLLRPGRTMVVFAVVCSLVFLA